MAAQNLTPPIGHNGLEVGGQNGLRWITIATRKKSGYSPPSGHEGNLVRDYT